MDWHAAGLRRLDGIIWALVAGVAGLSLLAAPVYGFQVVVHSFAAPAGTCLLLLAIAGYYGRRRNDPQLASALGCTAQVIAFAAVAAPLSYVAAAATGSWPLQDAALNHFDLSIGFDWLGLLGVMKSWPDFHRAMRLVYISLSVQMTVVVLLLGFTGRLAWLRVYTLAFMFAAIITIAISALVPAQGVWMHDALTTADPRLLPISRGAWPVYASIRDGGYRMLMAMGAEGIVTFPSLHAGLAVILIAAFWPVPVARWIGGTLNALMLVATPIDGAHYLADILAGVAVALISLAAARALVARLAAARQDVASFVPAEPIPEPVPVPSLLSSSR